MKNLTASIAALIIATIAASASAQPQMDASISTSPDAAATSVDQDGSPALTQDSGSPPPPVEPAPDASARAPEAIPVRPEALRLLHAPVSFVYARESLELHASFVAPERAQRPLVRYRLDAGPWREAPFNRGAADYVATIPGVEPSVSKIEYFIDVLGPSGTTEARFASEAAPQVVLVRRTDGDARELRDFRAYNGTRAEVLARGEYVDFGITPQNTADCRPPTPYCVDWYYHVEGSFRYRFLRVVRSIRFGFGHMRGYTTSVNPRAGAVAGPNASVGADYGLGEIEFGFTSWLHGSVGLLLGANELTVYAGATLRIEFIPTPYTQLSFGWWGLLGVGNVVDGWLRWTTVPRTPMGAGIELSNLPGANNAWGTRLLVEVARELGRYIVIGARGGYQARSLVAGGPSAGGFLAVRF